MSQTQARLSESKPLVMGLQLSDFPYEISAFNTEWLATRTKNDELKIT
jgi:hypothetical protein